VGIIVWRVLAPVADILQLLMHMGLARVRVRPLTWQKLACNSRPFQQQINF